MTGQQARECAEIIVSDPDYQGLKADELALFFVRLKAGKYGHFYNAVDTLHVTTALQQFTRELVVKRYKWFEELESEAREAEQREHAKTYLRPDEFRAWKAQYMARQNGDN